MDIETITKIVGLIAAIIGIFFAGHIFIQKNKQSQKVGKGGIGIQSGRDTNINK